MKKRDETKPSKFKWELKIEEPKIDQFEEATKNLVKKPRRVNLSPITRTKSLVPGKRPDYLREIINKKDNPKDKLLKKNSQNVKKQAIKNDVLVEGMNEIKVTLSGCCKPIPGDNIIGYITKGSGITIHRSNCKNIVDLDERLINVKWNDDMNKKFPTDLLIYTDVNDNLLDIITTAGSNNVMIDSVNTITKSEFKIYSLTVLVEDTDKLDKFCKDINNLKFVSKIERQIN